MSKRNHITAANRANNNFREWKAGKRATGKWKPFEEWKQDLIKKGKWVEKPIIEIKAFQTKILLRRNNNIIF
jgi:hypothetical protein